MNKPLNSEICGVILTRNKVAAHMAVTEMVEVGVRDILVLAPAGILGDVVYRVQELEHRLGCRLTYRAMLKTCEGAEPLCAAENFVGCRHVAVSLEPVGDPAIVCAYKRALGLFRRQGEGAVVVLRRHMAAVRQEGKYAYWPPGVSLEVGSMRGGKVVDFILVYGPESASVHSPRVMPFAMYDAELWDVLARMIHSNRGIIEWRDVHQAYLDEAQMGAVMV